MHPILNSLDGMENEWIKHMLFAFNAGDIPKFESIVPSVSQAVRPPLLVLLPPTHPFR